MYCGQSYSTHVSTISKSNNSVNVYVSAFVMSCCSALYSYSTHTCKYVEPVNICHAAWGHQTGERDAWVVVQGSTGRHCVNQGRGVHYRRGVAHVTSFIPNQTLWARYCRGECIANYHQVEVAMTLRGFHIHVLENNMGMEACKCHVKTYDRRIANYYQMEVAMPLWGYHINGFDDNTGMEACKCHVKTYDRRKSAL